MSGGIYLIQEDGKLVAMREQDYDSEELLQRLLTDYPDLLAGDQMNGAEPRRWLLVSREMAVPSEQDGSGRWALDHLFLDQDAVPTLVEVKRSTDTRIRREVVGQMLDYAANAVVYWPIEALRTQFEWNYPDTEQAEQALAEFLGPEADLPQFWQQAKENLLAGKVRLVFVADSIPTELQRIVEFLNEKMETVEVLAIEVKQFVGQNRKTLVPRVIGQTARAKQQKPSPAVTGKQWNESTFFAALNEKRGMEEAKVARQILEWTESRRTNIRFGKGSKYGSCVPYINVKGKDHQLFAIWTNGYIEIYFYWYAYKPPFDSEDKRREILNRLHSIPGISLPATALGKRPSIPLSIFKVPNNLQQFLDTFDWFLEQIKQA